MNTTPFTFSLPPELAAKEPPEKRGLTRDSVRLMVVDRATHRIAHLHFNDLAEFLRLGDLLVFNSSRTLPASLTGCIAPGRCIEVRLAQHLANEEWLALLLCRRGDPFSCGLREGMEIDFGYNLKAAVFDRDANIPRLWRLRFSKSGTELLDLIYRLGRPVRYEYLSAPWNLEYYQTVYAREPGSAEMPSAGRAFTWELLFALRTQGIDLAYILLHTGLSSYMDDRLDDQHPVSEEEYWIGAMTADKINRTHRNRGRVIAVGTTVVRALESAADGNGSLPEKHGYTRLHIDAAHDLKIVDGLLTGLHEPEASHLDLLTAFLPAAVLQYAYQEAVRERYLWHEFGDLNLIL